MKLRDLYFDSNGNIRMRGVGGKIKLFGLFRGIPCPKITFTKKEAEERGLDLKNKKGYYVKIDGRSVLIDIED